MLLRGRLCMAFCLMYSISIAYAETHVVEVGSPVHTFNPDTITANVGDTVQFRFHNSMHSVVRAAYRTPCAPYESVEGGGKAGFNSDLQTPQGDEILTWDLKINNTETLFFYCSAPESCNHYRMVGVINPNPNEHLDVQKDLAGKTTTVLQPGQPVAPEGAASKSKHIHVTLPIPAIIGISVGGALVIGLAGALLYLVGRSRSLEDEAKRREATVERKTWESPRYEPSMSPTMHTCSAPPVLPSYDMQDPKYTAMAYHQPYYMPGAGDAQQLRSSTASPGTEYGFGKPATSPGVMDANNNNNYTAHELDVGSERTAK
ncbi:unnamed protein product [Periconia digitata]|uniref:Extracellular serine-rich protein n=1 Tax=Periconia digitata TaxID=1303443 RepID=A0A9W4XFY2_9PLEO|nr:unnamed protein product [Periconia digitata]